jgi:hypothetical protein
MFRSRLARLAARTACQNGLPIEALGTHHCMFTARSDLDRAAEQQFADALSGISYDNPGHRAVLDAEGLRRWVAPHLDGYGSLREAAAQQGSRPGPERGRRRALFAFAGQAQLKICANRR